MTQAPWQQVQQGQPNGYPPQGQPWQQTPQPQPAAPQQQPQAQEEGDDEFFTERITGASLSFGDPACIGHPRGGEIVSIAERQQTNYDTKEPEFWPNSDRPIMVKVVTLQTAERLPNDPEDHGLRTAYLPQAKDITKAVIDALKQSSPNELRLKVGSQLWITRTGSRSTTRKDGKRGADAYTYSSVYQPRQGSSHDAFFGSAPAPQGAPVQVAQQQYGQPAQAAPWQQPAAQPQSQGSGVSPYAAPNGQPAGPQSQPAPWQQAPAPQGQAPWAQPGVPQGQAPNGYLQQAPAPQSPQQAPWAQPGVPQGTYQPPAPDPANPWGNQPQQQPGPNPYPQQ